MTADVPTLAAAQPASAWVASPSTTRGYIALPPYAPLLPVGSPASPTSVPSCVAFPGCFVAAAMADSSAPRPSQLTLGGDSARPAPRPCPTRAHRRHPSMRPPRLSRRNHQPPSSQPPPPPAAGCRGGPYRRGHLPSARRLSRQPRGRAAASQPDAVIARPPLHTSALAATTSLPALAPHPRQVTVNGGYQQERGAAAVEEVTTVAAAACVSGTALWEEVESSAAVGMRFHVPRYRRHSR